ncbi:MAG: cyclic peptide export ABC transporter [Nitrospinae bacterium]|nr:cyclic peptide export ABC transporter [Nitrospinota bacterium]
MTNINRGYGFSTIVNFYRREVESPGTRILIMATVSGISGAVLLGLINMAAQMASEREIHARLFSLFIAALLLYIYTRRFALEEATSGAEVAVNKVRVRITDKLRRADLQFIEGVGDTKIYTRISQETALLSQAAFIIVDALQSVILLVACFAYIFIISGLAFMMTVAAIAVGISLYFVNTKEINREMRQAAAKEEEFFELLSHVLAGFKEIKLNHRRNEEIYRVIKGVADETQRLKLNTNSKFLVDYMFGQVFFYALLGVMVFVLPAMVEIDAKDVAKLASTLLFIIGPLTAAVSSVQIFSKTSISIENLYSLEEMIDNSTKLAASAPPPPVTPAFELITLENLVFNYMDQTGASAFQVGPVDMEIKRGETIFLVGGNGSGKSTLLKLMTGLYNPRSGKIKIDGKFVEASGMQGYREYFTAIFGDFHLFDRLYGLEGVADGRVDELLRLVMLEKKTEFRDGKFSNLELSTGQRKRLALVVSFLEDKPIYVFDEWAADQDPEFRRFFYDTILSGLKERGKTVIAVSHDDRYFKHADRTLRMDYGRVVEATDNR